MITLNLEQPESLRITDRTGIQISIQTWVKNDLGIQILNTDKVITNCLYLKDSPILPTESFVFCVFYTSPCNVIGFTPCCVIRSQLYL